MFGVEQLVSGAAAVACVVLTQFLTPAERTTPPAHLMSRPDTLPTLNTDQTAAGSSLSSEASWLTVELAA